MLRRPSRLTSRAIGGAGVVSIGGVVPVSRGASAAYAAAASDASPSPIRMVRRITPSHRLDPDRALLEVGLLRDRVGGIERGLVDQLARVEERDEHDTLRRAVPALRLPPGPDLTPPGDQPDLGAAVEV